jgi:poly-gamma-glutamate synthesis protein (capsule biosynthesis protein)
VSSNPLHLLALGQSLIEHDLRARPYPGFAELRERLSHADLVLSNFEGAILRDANVAPTREGVFFHGAPPSVFDCLRDFSIKVLPLCNNHSFDLGAPGIIAAIEEARAREFLCAGTGANLDEASAPAFFESPFGKIALVACASKIPDASRAHVNHLRLNADGALDANDTRRILDAIERAAREANFVIAYQHDHYWEANRQTTPRWKMNWARACIDAGANIFYSHGVPLVHGIEIYQQRPIFYGLGNFIFHTKTPVGKYASVTWESVIADCTFRDGKLAELKLHALALNESGEAGDDFFRTRGRPNFADTSHAQTIFERMQKLSAPLGTPIVITSESAEIKI